MSLAEIPSRAASQPEARHDETRARSFALSYEQLAYLALLALALITRLWWLGDRALHHDETHHAYYSWLLFQGRGYIHDPLLHGPLLYYIGAFFYFLFGDSNMTARLGVALFSSVLVVLPYLMRRELGRGAALLASCYMLISPTFLYVGRFIRHDPYAVTFELLAFIGLVRYASTRRSLWLYVVAAALGLMFTTMETFFLYLAIFAPVLILLFFWKIWRPGAIITAFVGLLIVALIFVLPGKPQTQGDQVVRANGTYVCPSSDQMITAANPMVFTPGPLLGLPPLATADNDYALCVRNQPDGNFGVYILKLGQFINHPSIYMALILTGALLGSLYWIIWRRSDAEGMTLWERAQARGGSAMAIFNSLGRDRRLWVAFLVFFCVYALFFTAFFTNPTGVMSGAAGSLLYWLAQHGVQRGGQPNYYYLVILALYEPLLVVFGLAGIVTTVVLLLRRFRSGIRSQEGIEWGVIMPAILVWWSVATLGLYSWAGEKMPWLTLHVALPLVLLSAWTLSAALRWWRQPQAVPADQADDLEADANGLAWSLPSRKPNGLDTGLLLFLGIFAAIMVTAFVLLTIAIKPDSAQSNITGFIPLFMLLPLALMVVSFALWRGWRWSLGALIIAGTLMGALGSMRAAYQVSYLWGDVPREMLIYTQTSPDVQRVIDDLTAAAERRSGKLRIWYDNETVWNWYMRNFPDAAEQSPVLSSPPDDDVMAVLMLQENYNNIQNQQYLDGFKIQRYPLRWWLPEYETYRLPDDWLTASVTENSPFLMRVLRTPFDGRTAAQFWQYMLYRQLPVGIGSTDFVLAVRPELANEFGMGIGGQNTDSLP